MEYILWGFLLIFIIISPYAIIYYYHRYGSLNIVEKKTKAEILKEGDLTDGPFSESDISKYMFEDTKLKEYEIELQKRRSSFRIKLIASKQAADN